MGHVPLCSHRLFSILAEATQNNLPGVARDGYRVGHVLFFARTPWYVPWSVCTRMIYSMRVRVLLLRSHCITGTFFRYKSFAKCIGEHNNYYVFNHVEFYGMSPLGSTRMSK